MDYLDYTELRHHGIQGMKWGVRRYQNEDGSLTAAGKERYGTVGKNVRVKGRDIKQDRENFFYKAQKNDPRQEEIKSLYRKMNQLYEKNDFDGDDGGGGTTEASRQAGKKYMELADKAYELEDAVYNDASKQAVDYALQKYGTKRINAIKTADTAKAIAFIAGGIGLLSAAYLSHNDQ